MRILRDIIDSLGQDAPVREVTRGLFWTAVTSRTCGLSSTMIRDWVRTEHDPLEEAEELTRGTAMGLANGALSQDLLDASLGLAAINSLIEVDHDRCVPGNASEILMERGKDKNVAIVGHFPFTEDLRRVARNLWVMERHQRPGDYPEKDGEVYLPRADVIALSSTTLINHTLEGLLSLCNPGSLKMLVGPTTPLTPVLFDHGLDMISGSVVTDEAGALKSIREGANFRQLKRTGCVRLLTMIKWGR